MRDANGNPPFAEAKRLLRLLADQPTWLYGCRNAPGFSIAARRLAENATRGWRGGVDTEEWRAGYRWAAEQLP